MTSGNEPSGKGGRGQPGDDVGLWLLAAVFDVSRESFVEELQRRMTERIRLGAADPRCFLAPAALQHLTKPLVIRFRNSQQIRDHVQGEGCGEVPDELARPAGYELVDLAVGALDT